MTFSEFETRLNYYFNSTSGRDVYTLEKIFDGKVYPTMTTKEKKDLYEHLNSQYLDFYAGHELLKMIKNYNPDAFAEQRRKVTEEERIVNNFISIIFFDEKFFVKWLEEKFRKEKLWKVKLTIPRRRYRKGN